MSKEKTRQELIEELKNSFAEKWGWSFNTPNELKEAFGKNTQIVYVEQKHNECLSDLNALIEQIVPGEEDIKEMIEEAHRAGQKNQGHCDPSAYEAMVYYEKYAKLRLLTSQQAKNNLKTEEMKPPKITRIDNHKPTFLDRKKRVRIKKLHDKLFKQLQSK